MFKCKPLWFLLSGEEDSSEENDDQPPKKKKRAKDPLKTQTSSTLQTTLSAIGRALTEILLRTFYLLVRLL